ncbi:MAG: hypothetical protein J2P27_06805 [Actinobacteria bacterium]|nr:hypothetical protein [Actinomycetota bacterium]
MSVSTRKQFFWTTTTDGLRGRAAQAGSQVGALAGKAMPLAQQAMPMVSTAGTTVRQGAGSAVSRATPAVDAARSWAAPQLEQSARAISDTIAPMLSSALLNAAHKIEVQKTQPRPNRSVVVGAVMVTAAAVGAATAAAVRMRRSASTTITRETVSVESESPDPDLNGHSRIV